MSAIDTQNAKNIRDTMQIVVKVGESSDPYFEFDNSNLLSCELQLRSDLKPIDPTLPESEIIIRAYWPEDISEELITIADDTIITYQAGYEGDLSPVRTFYLAEQIQWEANVLTVHGVDAVHFLDANLGYSIFLPTIQDTLVTISGQTSEYRSNGIYANIGYSKNALPHLYAAFVHVVKSCISSATVQQMSTDYWTSTSSSPTYNQSSLIEGTPRDIIANMMNLVRVDIPRASSGNYNTYLTYIDAGIPKIDYRKPSSKWDVYETDCGDIKRNVNRNITTISTDKITATFSPHSDYGMVNPTTTSHKPNNTQEVGNAELILNVGASINLNTYTSFAAIKVMSGETYSDIWNYVNTTNNIQTRSQRIVSNEIISFSSYDKNGGVKCFKGNTFMGWTASTNYTIQNIWNRAASGGYIEGNNIASATFPIFGSAITLTSTPTTYTKSGSGITVTPSKTKWNGEFIADANGQRNILPDMGFQQLLNRSNETGSFTWKGDPRMQPRDVFTWHFLDGTTELRTIETINLKHEGGGTVATITYRKGIV